MTACISVLATPALFFSYVSFLHIMVPSTCIIDLFDLTTTINCLDEEDDGSQDMVNVTVNFPEFDKISQSNPVCDEKKNVYNGSKILHASNDDDTTTQEQPSTDDLGKNATTTRRKSVFNRVAASLKRNFKGSKQQDIRSYDVVGLNTSSRINSVTNEISLNKNDDHDERRSLRKKLDYEHLWETETDQEMVMSEFHKIILEGLSGLFCCLIFKADETVFLFKAFVFYCLCIVIYFLICISTTCRNCCCCCVFANVCV